MIEWITKSRKMWNQAVQALVSVEFLRLNINNDYNREMNDVDISDHLRTIYEFDHWLRNKKWWWAIFLYAMGVLLTNAYLVYCSVLEEAGVERRLRKTHYQFLLDVATSWIDLKEPDIRDVFKASAKHIKRAATVAASASTTDNADDNTATPSSTSNNRRRSRPQSDTISPDHDDDNDDFVVASPTRKTQKIANSVTPRATETPLSSGSSPAVLHCIPVRDSSLHPDKGGLRDRLNHYGNFHGPTPPKNKSARCALHCWFNRNWQVMQGVVCCRHCQVHLCIDCFELFHTERDLVQKKESLMTPIAEKYKTKPRAQS
jgi:hypothetical protein